MRLLLTFTALLLLSVPAFGQADAPFVRVGVIGLDTSHSPAFTRILNDTAAADDVAGYRVVAAYPHGSPDIESSVNRIPRYTEEMRAMGVEIVDSIAELLERVDVVLLETNDGRPHYAQARPVIEAGKPLFIDKPVAGSLADAVRIYDLAAEHGVPVFSSSSLRYTENARAIRAGSIGDVLGADVYSPATLEPTHPDLYWYGVHGVEMLFTVMGTGIETVRRIHTPDTDIVVGTWGDGRLGVFRGLRSGEGGYGGTAYGTEAISEIGPYDGYRPLVVEIVEFFRTGEPPVSAEETIEIFAFMTAADESKRLGGAPVAVAGVLAQARLEAADLGH